jgi:hypothetical protein
MVYGSRLLKDAAHAVIAGSIANGRLYAGGTRARKRFGVATGENQPRTFKRRKFRRGEAHLAGAAGD